MKLFFHHEEHREHEGKQAVRSVPSPGYSCAEEIILKRKEAKFSYFASF